MSGVVRLAVPGGRGRTATVRLISDLRPPAPLRLATRRDGGDVLIEADGHLSVRAAPDLAAALAAAEAGDAECVVLDLRHAASIDGAAVQVIVDAHHRLDGPRALLLIRGPRQVQRQFVVAGVDDALYFLD